MSALCNSKDCIGMFGSWLAKKPGTTKVAVLVYGVAQQSIDCGEGTVASFEHYGVARWCSRISASSSQKPTSRRRSRR